MIGDRKTCYFELAIVLGWKFNTAGNYIQDIFILSIFIPIFTKIYNVTLQSFSHHSEAQLVYYPKTLEDLPILMFLLFGIFVAVTATILFLVLTSSDLVPILFF